MKSMSPYWSQFVLLTLLSSLLAFKLLHRTRRRTRARGDEPTRTGAVLDAGSLQSRIRRLRKNYSGASRPHPTGSSGRKKVVDSLRLTIQRLAHFHPPRIHPSASDPHATPGGPS